MNSDKKIKVGMITNALQFDGVSMVVQNYCNGISKDNFEIKVLTGYPAEEDFCNKIDNDVEIIKLGKRKKNPFLYYINLLLALKKEKFDILHIHCNSNTVIIELMLGKISGVKRNFVHCHSTSGDHALLHKLLTPFLKRIDFTRVACSDLSGRWMYGGTPYDVLKNGIDTKKYVFSDDSRAELRKEMSIPMDAIVIGHVGSFTINKNQSFLLEVFKKYHNVVQNSFLVFVGIGAELKSVKEKCIKYDLQNAVLFLGNRNDTFRLYSAFDFFCLPSYYEGLPLTSIEAQVSGVRGFLSNSITHECDFTNYVDFLGLDNPETWVDAMLNAGLADRNEQSQNALILAERKGYDINYTIDKLSQMYSEVIKL